MDDNKERELELSFQDSLELLLPVEEYEESITNKRW
jgi:hypothetical protein